MQSEELLSKRRQKSASRDDVRKSGDRRLLNELDQVAGSGDASSLAGRGDPMVAGAPVRLQTGTVDIAVPVPFRCHIDHISREEIVGWVMTPTQPMRRSMVLLKEGGRILRRVKASKFRVDLVEAGIGDGCYSFALSMPSALLDGAEHLLDLFDEETGQVLTTNPLRWQFDTPSRGSQPAHARHSFEGKPGVRHPPRDGYDQPVFTSTLHNRYGTHSAGNAGSVGTRILFDISDLVYYIGEHANLTGIQRVQSSIVLSVLRHSIAPSGDVAFLSFDARARNWVSIPSDFLVSLLGELFLPVEQRLIAYSADEARVGLLPGARPFDGVGVLDDGRPSVLCLLGAAWVHQDYLYRVLALKRQFGTRFVMTVHDLIPIYARETCDQDTARVFEEFMRRALRHVDHILAVSENTAKDVQRYLSALQIPEPPITITKNGSSFAEFMAPETSAGQITLRNLPMRFVLFVATIEGRKNHQLMLEIWRRLIAAGDDPPHLICVGRLGWKSSTFISTLVETDYLDGRVHLLREISDTDLRHLYERCLFTVCPTLYEGWGLPVGESLALGKICVASDRASVPEVAGDCGVYIDIDDVDRSLAVIRNLIIGDEARREIETNIRRNYIPVTWRSVAERVVAACDTRHGTRWQEPYPYTDLPYSTEVSFGRLDRYTDGTGELLLTRILDARRGRILYDTLNERSFVLGEEIRSAGAWAQPEEWGTWLCHSGGELEFSLAADVSRFYYVFLLLRVSGLLHEQPVRLSANGERLWVGTISPNPKMIALRVQKRAVGSVAWRLRISAEIDLSTELRNTVTSLDSRMPTIGFERLVVVPENDTKTRLDILYSSV
jgi:glycosyltransferase involved in cell wall biosynthesis